MSEVLDPPVAGPVTAALAELGAALDRVATRVRLPWIEIEAAAPLVLNLDGEPVEHDLGEDVERAEPEAAKEALENGKIITKKLTETYKIEFTYDKMSAIMAFISQHQLTITKQHFELTCFVEIELEKANAAAIIEKFSEIQDISIEEV